MKFQNILVRSLFWRGMYFITLVLLNIFLSRYLQAANSGWIYYLTNIFTLLLMLSSLSMESGISYFASNNEIDSNKLASFSLLWALLVCLIVFIGFWIYFTHISSAKIISTERYIFYACTYITGILLTNFFTVLFYARRNYLLPNILMSSLNLFLIFYIPKTFSSNSLQSETVLNVYFIVFIVQGLILALAYFIWDKQSTVFSLPTKESFKKLIRFSLLALTANLIFFLVYRIDYWFVEKYCSGKDLGNYIQVSKLGQLMLIVPNIIANTVFPETAKKEIKDLGKILPKIIRIITFLFIVIVVVTALFGNFLFEFIFGPTFSEMYSVSVLLFPGIWALAILAILSAYTAGRNEIGINIRGSFVTLIFIAMADYLIIPTYGIKGAALISTLGYFLHMIYNLIVFKKWYKLEMKDFFKISLSDFDFVVKLFLKSK